jgi:hypothetical protein
MGVRTFSWTVIPPILSFSGIDKLEIYEEGYGKFLRERNEKKRKSR